MSVQDVAAVDRLSSLRRPAHPGGVPRAGAGAGAGASLPTSPVREDQRTSDTLRRAMARHQVIVLSGYQPPVPSVPSMHIISPC